MVIFSARLDETGTDGKSPYTVVGGAVATVEQWDELEAAWDRLLTGPFLEQWYEGMIKEKEARRAYGQRKPTKNPSSGEK